MNAVDVIQRDDKAAQNEKEVDEKTRIDDKEVVVKDRLFKCIMMVGDNENCKNAP